jgi:hypothetical protein
MIENHRSFIEQSGWIRRLTNHGVFKYGEPTVTIPLSLLQLEDQVGNPCQVNPQLIAADYVAFQRIKQTMISTDTERLRLNLNTVRAIKDGLDAP